MQIILIYMVLAGTAVLVAIIMLQEMAIFIKSQILQLQLYGIAAEAFKDQRDINTMEFVLTLIALVLKMESVIPTPL